jgi:hypothetical protein
MSDAALYRRGVPSRLIVFPDEVFSRKQVCVLLQCMDSNVHTSTTSGLAHYDLYLIVTLTLV